MSDQTNGSMDAELNRVAVDAAPDALVVVGADSRIVLANHRAREMFGGRGEPADLLGLNIDALLPESLRSVHAEHRSRYEQHPRAREMGSGLELIGQRFDGSEIPVEVSLSPFELSGVHYVVAAIRDLTERRAAEASLRATQDRLALVDERERIGRDLHDSVIQRLYGAGLAMQAALEGEPDRLRRVVGDAVGEIDGTIAEIRSVIQDLTRHEPAAGHLGDRLDDVVRAQAAALGVSVTLHVVGRPGSGVSARVADAVVAVVRECIANAHRHGDASDIVVDFDLGVDDNLRVVVHDDGTGFDPQAPSGGHGLDNLRARAAEFGGRFSVQSSSGNGARVTWTIPVSSGDDPVSGSDGSRRAPGTFYPVETGPKRRR